MLLPLVNRLTSIPIRFGAWAPLLPALLLASLILATETAVADQPLDQDVEYLRDIKPLLTRKCYGCHGVLKQEGGLRLDTRSLMAKGGDSGPAISARQPERSELLARVADPDSDTRMPPEGKPLTDAERLRLQTWIAAGAPAPADEAPQVSPESHWAFQPIATTRKPGEPDSIDEFIHRRLRQARLQPAAPASSLELVRRLHFVLHGLPPTSEAADRWSRQIDQAALEERKTVVHELIEELLASPRYGERWAQHWLDLVRYADTHGFEVNTPRENAWPYRDYVIRAFNDDKPYDQFITEQLAGDTVGEDAATGFLVAAAVLLPGQIGKDEESKRLARQDSLDEIVVGVTATFMGLTVGCARCHDHKFDPLTQQDYYSLQACFAGVEYGDRPLTEINSTKREKAGQLADEIQALERQFATLQPLASTTPIRLIDDEQLNAVELLAEKNGHGANPTGVGRGYKDDPGGADRGPNVSGGRYTWWDNRAGEDVFAWKLGHATQTLNGTDRTSPTSATTPLPPHESDRVPYRLWISWGVHGSGVHTRDARYVLDLDGDLDTRDDQTEIARADQYYFAGQSSGESEKKPLWSGFVDVGVHRLTPHSKLVLRGGETGTGITADVIALARGNDGQPKQKSQTQQQGCQEQRGRQKQPLLLRAPVSARRNVEHLAPIRAKHVRFTSLATVDDNRHEPCIDELEVYGVADPEQNLALASAGTIATSSGNYSTTGKHQLKHINDGMYGNSRSWISNQHGRGWVQLELPQPRELSKIVWGRDREEKFADRLAIDYRIEVSLDGEHWQLAASSQDRLPQGAPFEQAAQWVRIAATQSGEGEGKEESNSAASWRAAVKRLQTLRQQHAEWSAPQMAYAGKFREPDEIHVLRRGDPEQPLELVPPATPHEIAGTLAPAVTLPLDAPEAERRVALARWLASPQHPLTARVIVNRIWQQHFGAGFVETPSDFGLRTPAPAHLDLLDFLAHQLITHGWSIKHVQRLILRSQTFQQSAVGHNSAKDSSPNNGPNDEGAKQDAANRLLWHFPSRRLEAEAIRDSILQVSGELNLEMGGPGFNFFKTRGGLSGFPPIEEFTAQEKRRMIYAHKIRMERVPVFGAFDCPDAGQPTPKRSQSTTAIQALNLFNSPFVMDQAQVFAARIDAEQKEADGAGAGGVEEALDAWRIRRAFRHALGREPSNRELSQSAAVLHQHGLPTLCRVLFNTNEFLFIP